MATGSITSWQIEGEKVKVLTDFLFLGSKITADCDCSYEIRRWLLLGRKAMTNLDSVLKSRWQRSVKSRVWSSQWSHMVPWELDHKGDGTPKNLCLWTVVLEKTPESLLDSTKIKPVNLKGDKPWIFTGRTDAEAPVFWSSDVNRWLIVKVPDAGKDWGRRRRGHQRMRWLDSITNAMDMNLANSREMVRDREAWHAAIHGVSESRTPLGNWTTTKWLLW